MGKFDDEMWDLNPNSIGLPSLHRPKSSKNNTANGLLMDLFSAESTTTVKKRSKTIHVYGMNNTKAGDDFLDLISRNKASSKAARTPLQEKDLNTSRPESAKTIDLLDMGVLLSSQSQKTVPIEDGINLLQGNHDCPNEQAGLEPQVSNGYEVDELQSQISTVTLENEDAPIKRSVTLPIMGLTSTDDHARLTKSAGAAEIGEESVADSEEEPELLSTALSQSRKDSRSSTVNTFDQNRTLDTSLFISNEKIAYDDTLTEVIDSESQLTNANIQAEDFVKDNSEIFDLEHESVEPPNEGDIDYSDEALEDNQSLSHPHDSIPSANQDPLIPNHISDSHLQLSNICDKINEKVLHDKSSDIISEETNENANVKPRDMRKIDQENRYILAPILPLSYPSNRGRKRKTSLADICSKTNRARLPPRVGLSKKLKVDSLHDYLKK